MKIYRKWDTRFLLRARDTANWSKDPSTKVGAVVVNERNVAMGEGYNGFARGVLDTKERLENRELRYKLVLHAEENALAFANRTQGCTLFSWPIPPCPHCMSLAIQHGIVRVVAPKNDGEGRWPYDLSLTIAKEAGVLVEIVDVGFVGWESRDFEDWVWS